MNVGGVSTSEYAAESAAGVQHAASEAAMQLLDATMDAAAQMMMTLLDSMAAANPPGVGGSVNTYA